MGHVAKNCYGKVLGESKMVKNFSDVVQEVVAGKKVIDIGPVACKGESSIGVNHLSYTKGAAECVGMDANREGVLYANKRGFPYFRYGNIELRIDTEMIVQEHGTFDVAIMTEVIEHLSNLGHAFNNIRTLLNDGGKLVITTPNPFFPVYFSQMIEYSQVMSSDGGHIMWHDRGTLDSLQSMYGFHDREYYYSVPVGDDTLKKLGIRKAKFWMCKRLLSISVKGDKFKNLEGTYRAEEEDL